MSRKDKIKAGKTRSNKEKINQCKLIADNLKKRAKLNQMFSEGIKELVGTDFEGIENTEIKLKELIDNTLEAFSEPEKKEETKTKNSSNSSTIDLQFWHKRKLSERHFPVIFIGSHNIEGKFFTQAVGIDNKGYRVIIGLWKGSISSKKTCREITAQLTKRELRTDKGLLVIIAGSTLFAEQLEKTFKGIFIAHGHYTLKKTVLSHLPPWAKEELKPKLEKILSGANTKQKLKTLIEELKREHPGAAKILGKHEKYLLTVNDLNLSKSLFESLKSAGPVRVAFKNAVDNLEGELNLKNIIKGLKVSKTRRIAGYRGIAELVKKLKKSRPV